MLARYLVLRMRQRVAARCSASFALVTFPYKSDTALTYAGGMLLPTINEEAATP
jgi:hypothetical protein